MTTRERKIEFILLYENLSEEEKSVLEKYHTVFFLAEEKYTEKIVDGEVLYKKTIVPERLVILDQYTQEGQEILRMMKLRKQFQHNKLYYVLVEKEFDQQDIDFLTTDEAFLLHLDSEKVLV